MNRDDNPSGSCNSGHIGCQLRRTLYIQVIILILGGFLHSIIHRVEFVAEDK